MSWIGKMVGGAVGFALGGPVGAMAGALFGHAFDVNDEHRPEGGADRLLSNDYAVLNCDSSDSEEEIRKQYRRLASEFHPDKIASRGLPEKFTVAATEKFQKIQQAYDNIKRARNMD